MIKTQVLVKRKAGMSREDFAEDWPHCHAAIAGAFDNIKRETISVVRADRQRAASPWDGLISTWWDGADPAACARMAREHDLVDWSACCSLVVCEINTMPQCEPPSPDPNLIKIVNPLRKRDDLTMEAFNAYWRGPHGLLSNEMPHMMAYIQNHVHPAFHAVPKRCDGIAESWFNSWEDILALTRSDAFARVKEDEPNILPPDSLFPMVCREYQTIKLRS